MSHAITTGAVAALKAMSDAELITATRAGDEGAYAELYSRHVDSARAAGRSLARSRADADDAVSDAFTRVLQAIRNGGGPQVAFRPYLLSAVRNAYFDRTRKDKRIDDGDDPPDQIDLRALADSADDDDRKLAAQAFASLPERWQLVLWHTEVEGMQPAEVAPLLGVAPNAVAALAYRAREGLRQAYLQAHLQQPTPLDCRESRPKLGAYVRDGLSMRDRRKVDEHLEDCDRCRALLLELTEANSGLRGVLVPLLIGVPAAAYLGHLGVGGKGLLWFLRSSGKARNASLGGAAAAAAVVVAAVAAGGGKTETAVASVTTLAPTTTRAPITTVAPTDPVVITFETVAETDPATTLPPVTDPPPPPTDPPVPVETTTTTIPFVTPTFADTTTTTTTTARVRRTTTTTTEAATTTTTETPTTALRLPTMSVEITAVGMATSKLTATVDARVRVQGGSAGVAITPNVRFKVPDGASLASTNNWNCTSGSAQVACTVPAAMTDGQASSARLVFNLPDLTGAPPVKISISAAAGPVTSATNSATFAMCPVTPSPTETVLFCSRMNGSVTMIGNSSMTCDELTGTQCVEARSGTATPLARNNRQNQPMVFVNDGGKGTVNASSATLTLPSAATVARAVLVWAGDATPNVAGDTALDRTVVQLIGPSGTRTNVAAERVTDVGTGKRYAASADVTSLVTGSGAYTVADIAATTDTDRYAGWELLVAYRDSSAPLRTIAMVDRFTRILNAAKSSISFGGVVTRSGSRNVTIAIGSTEGDREIPETADDDVTLNGVPYTPDSLNPAHRFFASSGGSGRSPGDVNLFGIDVDVASFSVPATDATLVLSASSNTDAVNLLALAIAIDP